MIKVDGATETRYYYHYDGLGSVVALSNVNRQVVECYSYDSYGNPTGSSSVGNPYFFTGRNLDTETGLYYYRARMYDPAIGRFLQPDPIGYAGGLNFYGYVDNNPLNWIDPLGLKHYTLSETEAILKEARESIYDPFRHFMAPQWSLLGQHGWDWGYSTSMEVDKFTVPLSIGSDKKSIVMSASSFGNFMAGYCSVYHAPGVFGPVFGYYSARGFGNALENVKRHKFPNPFWGDDPESIRDINLGAGMGVLQKLHDFKDTLNAITDWFSMPVDMPPITPNGGSFPACFY
jgi:RHS repeat-associated protein